MAIYGQERDIEDIITLAIKKKGEKTRVIAREEIREAFCNDIHQALKVGRNNGFIGLGDIASELKKVLDEDERDFLKTLL